MSRKNKPRRRKPKKKLKIVEQPKRSTFLKASISGGLVALLGLGGYGIHCLTSENRRANSTGIVKTASDYELACANEDLRQGYLSRLWERVKDNNPYFDSLGGLHYVPNLGSGGLYARGADSVVVGEVSKNIPKGTKPPMRLSQLAFDPRVARTEDDVLSIVDNESVHAFEEHTGRRYFPELYASKSDAVDIGYLFSMLNKKKHPNLSTVLREYHSSLHQVMMIEEERRKVSKSMNEYALQAYHNIRKLLFERTREKSYQDLVSTYLRCTSLENIRKGGCLVREKGEVKAFLDFE